MNRKSHKPADTGEGWVFLEKFIFFCSKIKSHKEGVREVILKEVGSPPEKWIYKPDIDLAQQHILVKLRFSLNFQFW